MIQLRVCILSPLHSMIIALSLGRTWQDAQAD